MTKALARLDEMEGNQGSKSEKVKDLETKLANAKEALEKANENRNQGLQAALSDELADKTKTIELLENDLAEALARSAETSKLDDDSRIKELERELAMTKIELDESQQRNSVLGENTESVKSLRLQLEEALAKLEAIQKDPPNIGQAQSGDRERITKLEKDLSDAEQSVTVLQVSLDAEEGKRLKLQGQLNDAMAKLEAMEVPVPESSEKEAMDFVELEEELAAAQNTIAELQARTEAEKQGRIEIERELDAAMDKLASFEGNSATSPDNGEVEELKKSLAEKDRKQKDLEKELNAAIESVNEMEADLNLPRHWLVRWMI